MDNFTVLSIPEISNERQIWLIRTNGGLYYNDFTTNKYVALGWDAVSVDLLLNSSISNDAKKEKINELYPDEKRPGLIFSQLYNFHCVMNNGDLVLIPSEGTKFIRVGILDETVEEVSHINNSNEEYAVCSYTHKRKVKWFSEIDVSRDIYLSKIMKVQQTIANITKYADYIYRNIYSCYIVDDFIHLSLQKTSSLGYKTVMWSFAYCDWDEKKQPSQEEAIKIITKNFHSGEIMLLHSNSKTNSEVLDKIIKEAKNQGYEFKSLDEFKN